ncbi:LA protein like protein, partial [Plakobranchus ocellatus]
KVRQQMTKNAVLHISGMNQETEREDVREFFLKHGDVSWVDFDRGVTEGYIRLKEPNGAFSTLESLNKLEGGVVINGASVHVRVVEGDEELQYWQKMYRDIAERKQLKKEGLLKHRAGAKYKARLSRMQNQKRGRRHDRYFDGESSLVFISFLT